MSTIIVGASHGGVAAAVQLRESGYDRPIVLIHSGQELPYHRPPLSKAYLAGKTTKDRLILRAPAYYDDQNIELLSDEWASQIDRAGKKVQLKSSWRSFDQLILAVGSENLTLPSTMGSFDNMMSLRDIADADRIMIAMEAAENIVIIGGGFIGLEIAATAAQQGKTVTVIEMQPGLLSRVMTPNATDHILQKHQSAGVKVRLNCRLTGFQSNGSRITEVETDSCPPISADLVIVGIGARANTALAAAAGLAVSNGVEVDEFCRTNGADVFAIGDCALAPTIYGESPVRLESVQNATDQAKAVAKTIAGDPTPYRDVPWFWSDQYDIKLQMAGLHHAGDHEVLRGDPESGRFSVCFLREGKLAAMHSVNQPADHMASRQLIAKQIPVTPQQLADPALRLKQLI